VSWISAEWFDHRYFFRDESGRCYYTCGLARECGAIIVRNAEPDQFLADIWLNSLNFFEDNPVVVGFIVEQICLSVISSIGFRIGDLHWNSVKSKILSSDMLSSISLAASETLYIPDRWNYKDIHALYLYIDERKKTALVVPIQITINPFHKDSEALFYADWERWVDHFEGYTLSSTFVWIVEHQRSWKIVEEKLRSLRSGTQLIAPQHKQMFVTTSQLHEPLGRRLEARHKRLQSSKSLSVELTFASDIRSREIESQDDHQAVCEAERMFAV
jgi:hypothetical protein